MPPALLNKSHSASCVRIREVLWRLKAASITTDSYPQSLGPPGLGSQLRLHPDLSPKPAPIMTTRLIQNSSVNRPRHVQSPPEYKTHVGFAPHFSAGNKTFASSCPSLLPAHLHERSATRSHLREVIASTRLPAGRNELAFSSDGPGDTSLDLGEIPTRPSVFFDRCPRDPASQLPRDSPLHLFHMTAPLYSLSWLSHSRRWALGHAARHAPSAVREPHAPRVGGDASLQPSCTAPPNCVAGSHGTAAGHCRHPLPPRWVQVRGHLGPRAPHPGGSSPSQLRAVPPRPRRSPSPGP